jgi:hypothetical protein
LPVDSKNEGNRREFKGAATIRANPDDAKGRGRGFDLHVVVVVQVVW